jgi:Tfp pilus tip-associated adhesin PilY1
MGAGMPASARFAAIACRCLTVSGRRGRSRLPNAAPRELLQQWQHGTRLASVCGPPRAAGTGQWSTVVAGTAPQCQHCRPLTRKTSARIFRQPGGHCHVPPMVPNTATAPVVAGLDLGHSVVKDAYMTSEANSVAKSGQESVVGSDAHRTHKILAEAGPNAAIALVRCKDQETRQMVAAAAADSARASWDGSLTEFLAALDPGSTDDWVRAALGEPSSTNR